MYNSLRSLKKYILLQKSKHQYKKLYTGLHGNLDPDLHIAEAAGWLKRAQDSGEDRGVSYGAHLAGDFLPSYPETTGYIIPTFLLLADFFQDKDYFHRAEEMGDWEIAIQMESGAVMGGRADTLPTPAVFNTGMVMLGWLSLYEATQNGLYLDAVEKAAQWLHSIQEKDGSWFEGNSRFANPDSTTYNVRVAWALAWHGKITGNENFIHSAIANGEYALQNQQADGWFSRCCLTDAKRPLLHTLAYTMRGLWELGEVTGKKAFSKGAVRTADALLEAMDDKGFLSGRFYPGFTPAVPWCCLTGSAQTSIVWSKIYLQTGEKKYADAVKKVNQYLMARHDITSKNPVIRGGVPGSWPVWGAYGQFTILNWATKFFLDALIFEKKASVK